MKYMPFRDDQQPVYADDQESTVFRVKDLKTLIEEHTSLHVTDLKLMVMDDEPEKLKALYSDCNPDRAWIVFAEIDAPDGPSSSEVLVIFKDGKLSLPRGVFLHLKTFGAAARQKAKDQATPFTRDYIYSLEECVSDMWRHWRDLCYYAAQHKDEPEGRLLREGLKESLNSLYKSMQNVGFLDSKNERHNPFPTGFIWSYHQAGREEE